MKRILFLSMSILLVNQIDATIVPSGSALSIISQTMITQPGTYRLANDFVGTITILASNVILDLDNYTISALGNGIEATNQSDLVIKNGAIENGDNNGIFIDTCSNVQIHDLDLQTNGTGIQILDSSGACVVKVNSRNNTFGGFSLNNSTDCFIENCIALNNAGRGFNLENNSNNNVITNCVSRLNSLAGMQISLSRNNIVQDCLINENALQGSLIISSTNIAIIQCQFIQNQNEGIRSLTSRSLQIMQCTIEQNASNGMFLMLNSQNKIIENIFRNNGTFGISTSNFEDSLVKGNCCSGHTLANGIDLDGTDIDVLDNIASGNLVGINLATTSSCTVMNNKCNNNNVTGINVSVNGLDNCLQANVTNFNGTNGVSNSGTNSSFFSHKSQQNGVNNYLGVSLATIGIFDLSVGDFVSTPSLCCNINISVIA